MLTTTLEQLREANLCAEGLATLKSSLPANHKETDEITLAHILESNGLDHAIWALRTQEHRYAVHFAAACAEHVTPIYEEIYPNDDRLRKAIEIAKSFPEADYGAAYAAAYAARDAGAHAIAQAARAAAYAAYAAAYAVASAAAYVYSNASTAADYAAYVAGNNDQKEIYLKIVSGKEAVCS